MKTKVIGYVRVSTVKQDDVGISIEMQRARIESYCLAMDLELVMFAEDRGVSAATMDRPGLRLALDSMEAGKAEALVVVRLDRLTRSVRDLGELVERYFGARFRLLSLSDPVDTSTATGRMVLNVLTSVAQWERESHAEATREAMAYKKAKGEFTGGNSAPYGYTVENGKLVPNDAEQAIIARAKQLQSEGLSGRAIGRQLDVEGLRPRLGGAWQNQSIMRMLQRN